MTTLDLHGRITKKGKLEIELPAGLPEGDVRVRIDLPSADTNWEDMPWTEAEIQELMTSDPKSGAEIATMLQQMEPIEFVDPEIIDPVEWVETQRRKESDRLKAYWEGKA